MSNTQVGNVYQQIINDVIEASRVDFEEGGVDENMLDELRKGWQKKLTQQQLATFPWDPKPEPASTPATAAAASAASSQPTPANHGTPPQPVSNGNGAPHGPSHQTGGLAMPPPSAQSPGEPLIKPEPNVKIEPGLESTPVPPPIHQQSGHPSQQHGVAQQRVIAQLQNAYGDRAAASINKLREQPINGAQPQGQARPGVQSAQQAYPAQYQSNSQQQYQSHMAAKAAAQQQQQQRAGMPNGQRPNPSQLDGAPDAESHVGVLLRQSPAGQSTEMGRVEIDNLLHTQIAANAKAMEGGGFMAPLKRVKKGKGVAHPSNAAPNEDPARFDGVDDEIKSEDDDEDAINSELDDPDDNVDENEDDDDAGQIMLCMYDKVQRVKNKWKCVLKDGVLNVNGKDYVFHKATGEYEW